MPPPPLTSFSLLDWAVVALYAVIVVVLGIVSGRPRPGRDDAFLAGNSMPAWAVAISALATSLSAATFLGGPQIAYTGNLTYLSSQIGGLIAMVVVVRLFLPAFYARGVVSIYELLGHAWGPRPRLAASVMFMIGRVFASGARLFMVAIPFALIVFGDLRPVALMSSIAVIGLMAALYTALGGIRAVIWTDVLQAVVVFGTIGLVVVLLLDRIPASPAEMIDAWRTHDKLTLIDTSIAPDRTFTLWTALIGFALLNVAAYGTDQDLTQRLLTCRNQRSASRAMIGATLLGIPVVLLFMFVGLLLWVYYQQPGLMGGAAPTQIPDDSRKVLLNFALSELPTGVRGLLIAGVFAAAMSSMDSALNAMASTTVCDVLRRFRPDLDAQQERRATRFAVFGWAVVLILFAWFCIWWQQHSEMDLLSFALSVMIYAYGGLLGLFLSALLTRRGGPTSAIVALVAGFAVALITEEAVLSWMVSGIGLADEFALAFPWRLTLATAVSFGVCQLESRPRGGEPVA